MISSKTAKSHGFAASVASQIRKFKLKHIGNKQFFSLVKHVLESFPLTLLRALRPDFAP